MILNIQNDESNLIYKTLVEGEIDLVDLEQLLRKQFNISEKWIISFFEVDENRVLRSTEILRNKNEYNLKILKSKKTDDIKFLNQRDKNIQISDLISNVTGGKTGLKKTIIKKSKFSNDDYEKENQSWSLSDLSLYNTVPLLREELDIMYSFQERYSTTRINETHLNSLIEMGFEASRSRLALIMSNNQLHQAGHLLTSAEFEDTFNEITNNRSVILFLIFESSNSLLDYFRRICNCSGFMAVLNSKTYF